MLTIKWSEACALWLAILAALMLLTEPRTIHKSRRNATRTTPTTLAGEKQWPPYLRGTPLQAEHGNNRAAADNSNNTDLYGPNIPQRVLSRDRPNLPDLGQAQMSTQRSNPLESELNIRRLMEELVIQSRLADRGDQLTTADEQRDAVPGTGGIVTTSPKQAQNGVIKLFKDNREYTVQYGEWLETLNATTPAKNSTEPSVDLGEPSVDLGKPNVDLGEPSVDLDEPSVDLGEPSVDLGKPNVDLGEPSLDLGEPSVDLGEPSVDQGKPNVDLGEPSLDLGEPSVDLGKPSVDQREPSDKPLQGTLLLQSTQAHFDDMHSREEQDSKERFPPTVESGKNLTLIGTNLNVKGGELLAEDISKAELQTTVSSIVEDDEAYVRELLAAALKNQEASSSADNKAAATDDVSLVQDTTANPSSVEHGDASDFHTEMLPKPIIYQPEVNSEDDLKDYVDDLLQKFKASAELSEWNENVSSKDFETELEKQTLKKQLDFLQLNGHKIKNYEDVIERNAFLAASEQIIPGAIEIATNNEAEAGGNKDEDRTLVVTEPSMREQNQTQMSGSLGQNVLFNKTKVNEEPHLPNLNEKVNVSAEELEIYAATIEAPGTESEECEQPSTNSEVVEETLTRPIDEANLQIVQNVIEVPLMTTSTSPVADKAGLLTAINLPEAIVHIPTREEADMFKIKSAGSMTTNSLNALEINSPDAPLKPHFPEEREATTTKLILGTMEKDVGANDTSGYSPALISGEKETDEWNRSPDHNVSSDNAQNGTNAATTQEMWRNESSDTTTEAVVGNQGEDYAAARTTTEMPETTMSPQQDDNNSMEMLEAVIANFVRDETDNFASYEGDDDELQLNTSGTVDGQSPALAANETVNADEAQQHMLEVVTEKQLKDEGGPPEELQMKNVNNATQFKYLAQTHWEEVTSTVNCFTRSAAAGTVNEEVKREDQQSETMDPVGEFSIASAAGGYKSTEQAHSKQRQSIAETGHKDEKHEDKDEDDENEEEGEEERNDDDNYNEMKTTEMSTIEKKLADVLLEPNDKKYATRKDNGEAEDDGTKGERDKSDKPSHQQKHQQQSDEDAASSVIEIDDAIDKMPHSSGKDETGHIAMKPQRRKPMKSDTGSTQSEAATHSHHGHIAPLSSASSGSSGENSTHNGNNEQHPSTAEIAATNWWHTLPYAEIRKFLNTIFDSAAQELYQEIARKSKEMQNARKQLEEVAQTFAADAGPRAVWPFW